jgi:hypothetical protein
MEQRNDASTTEDTTSVNHAVIGWGIAAVVFAIVCVTINNSAMVLGASFFMKCLAAIVGALTGWIGALIGDAIRKVAHPDAVYTHGGMLSLIWIKLFWAFGPQIIGLVIGGALGCGLVLR